MAKAQKPIEWQRVSFEKPKRTKPTVEEVPMCKATFRTNGQIVLNDLTMGALDYSQYINLFVSHKDHLIAMKAVQRDAVDAIRLAKAKPEAGKDISFFNKPIYAWLCELMKRENVVIILTGEVKDDMVVFNLKTAEIKEKRVTNRGAKQKDAK